MGLEAGGGVAEEKKEKEEEIIPHMKSGTISLTIPKLK